jgi:hypothetical protein
MEMMKKSPPPAVVPEWSLSSSMISGSIKCMGYVAHTREMINAYILVEKQKERDHLRDLMLHRKIVLEYILNK